MESERVVSASALHWTYISQDMDRIPCSSQYGVSYSTYSMDGYSDLGVSHVHMHIISSDLCSPSLKNKKHYNSFHPKLGFFLHLNDVLEWFDGVDSHHQMVIKPIARYTPSKLTALIDSQMSQLPTSQYEPLLKESLQCWRCHASQKNIPALKDHLEGEWKREKEKALLHQKRKREGPIVVSSGQDTDNDDDAGRVRQRKRPEDNPALENQTASVD